MLDKFFQVLLSGFKVSLFVIFFIRTRLGVIPNIRKRFLQEEICQFLVGVLEMCDMVVEECPLQVLQVRTELIMGQLII